MDTDIATPGDLGLDENVPIKTSREHQPMASNKATDTSIEKPVEPELLQVISPIAIATNAFTFFPKLPLELRLKIWREFVPRASLIEIDAQFAGDNATVSDEAEMLDTERAFFLSEKYDLRNHNRTVTYETSLPWEILHTNSESRKEALRFCTASLNQKYHAFDLTFNPKIDIIYYCDNHNIISGAEQWLIEGRDLNKEALSKIEHVAITIDCLGSLNDRYPFKLYQALKDITIVLYAATYMRVAKEVGRFGGLAAQFDFKFLSASHSKQMMIMEERKLRSLKGQIERRKLQHPNWEAPSLRFAILKIDGEEPYRRYIFDRKGGPQLNEGSILRD